MRKNIRTYSLKNKERKETVLLIQNITQISGHKIKRPNIMTLKIGIAPVYNLTASAYASDLMHFPSLAGRS